MMMISKARDTCAFVYLFSANLLFLEFILLFPEIQGQFCSSKEGCRQLEFKPTHTFDGKRLENHLIRTDDVIDGDFCETLCYMEPNCVSYNMKKVASSDGKYKCELNNATFEGQKAKLMANPEYLYRGAENACLQNSCENNASCQTGFTDKGYRCLCTGEFKGPYCNEAYPSCKQIFDQLKARENRSYLLELPGYGRIPVYCHMTTDYGLGACGNGGWTLVMKINGSKQTFRYYSELWSNKDNFSLDGGKTLFDDQETKLPTYWNTSFSKICLGMITENLKNFVVISKEASSLHALIADGEYRATSLGRETWKSLIGSKGSLQPNCNKEGFNAACGRHDSAKARIGILGNNEPGCHSCDSRIGFGTNGDSNTCGNYANFSPYNEDIRVMGYILVQ